MVSILGVLVLLECRFLIGALGCEGFLRVVVVQDGGDGVAHGPFVTPENVMNKLITNVDFKMLYLN